MEYKMILTQYSRELTEYKTLFSIHIIILSLPKNHKMLREQTGMLRENRYTFGERSIMLNKNCICFLNRQACSFKMVLCLLIKSFLLH